MNKMAFGLVLSLALGSTLSIAGCGKSSDKDSSSVSPTPETVVDTTITDMAGNYETPCVSTSAINGSSAWKKEVMTISANGTYSYLIKYYSNNTCNSTTLNYIYSPGTIAVVGETTSPANGHIISFTITSTSISTTSSTAGRDHLTTNCTNSSWNLNGGIAVSNDYTCPGDSRYSTKGNGTVGYAAIVNNTTSIATTAITQNLPGVLSQNSVATSTTLTWTKN